MALNRDSGFGTRDSGDDTAHAGTPPDHNPILLTGYEPGGVFLRESRRSGRLLAVTGTLQPAAADRGSAGPRASSDAEEEIFLSVDGSATVYVNASLAALVNLRGVDLKTDPTRP